MTTAESSLGTALVTTTPTKTTTSAAAYSPAFSINSLLNLSSASSLSSSSSSLSSQPPTTKGTSNQVPTRRRTLNDLLQPPAQPTTMRTVSAPRKLHALEDHIRTLQQKYTQACLATQQAESGLGAETLRATRLQTEVDLFREEIDKRHADYDDLLRRFETLHVRHTTQTQQLDFAMVQTGYLYTKRKETQVVVTRLEGQVRQKEAVVESLHAKNCQWQAAVRAAQGARKELVTSLATVEKERDKLLLQLQTLQDGHTVGLVTTSTSPPTPSPSNTEQDDEEEGKEKRDEGEEEEGKPNPQLPPPHNSPPTSGMTCTHASLSTIEDENKALRHMNERWARATDLLRKQIESYVTQLKEKDAVIRTLQVSVKTTKVQVMEGISESGRWSVKRKRDEDVGMGQGGDTVGSGDTEGGEGQ